MRKCRNWQTSKTKDLVTIAVVWVQVPSSASKDLNLWLGSFLRTETWTQGSYLRFAPVGANPRSTGSRAPHLPHYLIWCGSLINQGFRAFFIFKLFEHPWTRSHPAFCHWLPLRRQILYLPAVPLQNVTLLCRHKIIIHLTIFYR